MVVGNRVAVIIPAFNAASSIERAIASATAQTVREIEIVVVDDASTDDTPKLVARMAETDPRVRLIRQRVNCGPGAARNRALDEAGADWIAILDADDYYEPDRLERLLALAEGKGADMVADNLILESEIGAFAPIAMIPESHLPTPQRMDLAGFVTLNEGRFDLALRNRPRFSFGFLKPVIRRDFLAGHVLRYDPRNRYAEDYMFAVRCLTRGAAWWLTPEPLYHYAVRDGSATHVQSADDLGRLVEFDQRILADPAYGADPRTREAFLQHMRAVQRRYHYRRFADAVKQKRFTEAGSALFESPASAGDVLRIGFWNSRAILTKALRGGYSTPLGRR